MRNTMQWTNPLDIRITGSGEYVKEMVGKLEDIFADAEYDRMESIRQSYEA